MIIETDSYTIESIAEDSKVVLKGTLRLQGREQYLPIFDLLMEAAAEVPSTLTVDMRELEFLNSSGISALSLFVIEMRKTNKTITIVGSKAVSWQAKSLINFQRLYDKVEIVLD